MNKYEVSDKLLLEELKWRKENGVFLSDVLESHYELLRGIVARAGKPKH